MRAICSCRALIDGCRRHATAPFRALVTGVFGASGSAPTVVVVPGFSY